MKGRFQIFLPGILLTGLTLLGCNTPLDIDPPKIEIISPQQGATYYTTMPIELGVVDSRNVDRVEIFLDNQLVETLTREPFVKELDISEFEQKLMIVRVVAHVRGGNPVEAQLSVNHSHGLKIVSPSGGEVWPERSTQTITWERCGSMADDVSLYYSLDGGVSWTPIIASVTNDGSYLWTLPDISESQTSCQVKISCTDNSYSAISDDRFTISQWSPKLVGSCKVSGYPIGIFLSENYAYMTDGYRGLEIINILDPTNPTLVATYVTPGDRTWSVFVAGTNAYVADGFKGLHVIDVFKPASPRLVKSYDMPGYAYDVLVSENYAYVADGNAGLQILNVSNPESLTLVGVYNTPGTARSLFKSGSVLYVADGDAGLQIINVSNPANPTLTVVYDTPGNAQGLFISGIHAYVADMDAGLQIVDISIPTNPTLAGVYDTMGVPHGVFVSGNYAYVTDMNNGLWILNVSNPASPTLAGSTDKSVFSFAMEVLVSGNYAYVTEHGGRLLIYDVSGLP